MLDKLGILWEFRKEAREISQFFSSFEAEPQSGGSQHVLGTSYTAIYHQPLRLETTLRISMGAISVTGKI
jgi:hypothetical protein